MSSTYAPVRDRRILAAMSRNGHIVWPVVVAGETHNKEAYVEHTGEMPATFTYRKRKYTRRYVDGCFFPFVFLRDQ